MHERHILALAPAAMAEALAARADALVSGGVAPSNRQRQFADAAACGGGSQAFDVQLHDVAWSGGRRPSADARLDRAGRVRGARIEPASFFE